MKRILYHLVKAYTSPLARRFDRALKDPIHAQQQVLENIVQDLKETEYGVFYNVNNISDFKKSIPLVNYDDISHWMQRQREEEGSIMVASNVALYEKTSGSTGPHKYIPYTMALRRSFTRMFLLWAHNLIANVDGLGKGKFYFSVSPNFDEERLTERGVPVGLENDADYLGAVWRRVLSPFMLADQSLGKIRDPDTFKQALCFSLLSCAELETISVWNPSFLTLVLQWITDNRELVLNHMGDSIDHDRKLALESETIDWQRVWPKLKLISCWADANAEPLAEKLRESFPDIIIQGKGLLATEAPMTIPMMNVKGGVPLVTETYFEFLREDEKNKDFSASDLITLADLEAGQRYEIVVSQRGGLYRYRMGDQVEVVGKINNTPTLKFVGRNNRTSDLVGEKMNESFVRDVIQSLPIERVSFQSLMAARNPIDRYVLILDTEVGDVSRIETMLEDGLQKSYHYRHARALGQLSTAKVVVVSAIENIISDHSLESGKSLGNMKQNYLMLSDSNLEKRIFGGF